MASRTTKKRSVNYQSIYYVLLILKNSQSLLDQMSLVKVRDQKFLKLKNFCKNVNFESWDSISYCLYSGYKERSIDI